MNKVRLIASPNKDKKWRALFSNGMKVDFGQKGYEDFTTHGSLERKALYLNRHRKRENWDNPYTAGSLSRWILWNKPTIEDSLKDYKSRFGFV